ncbi:DUF4382 domain-containing protein [Arhodomonas sp. AD133]|uniref:DUF4382 domain-containing protein n=1 Tax=Arhodomonas sp. AD133 TaxID=3415009 RepID=UPI003EC0948F
MPRTSSQPGRAALAALLGLSLAACGGGGGSDDNDNSADGGSTETASTTGNVAVLMTDAPTDTYEQINLTVTGITLLPDEDATDVEPVTLFEGERTVDLLQLRDYTELFSLAEEVPVADYEKVRLAASRVELVDTDTDPVTQVGAELPSGKVDLVPEDGLQVTADRTLYLELDVDAANSLLVTQAGADTVLFRPVVMVETFEEDEAGDDSDADTDDSTSPTEPGDDASTPDSEEDDAPLLSITGELRSVTDEHLLVCPSAQAAAPACVRVALDDEATVFDTTGAAIDATTLVAGDSLVAMGLLERDPEDGRRELDTLSITLGTRPTVGTRGGVATASVDAEGNFTLEGGGDGRAVTLAPETPIVDEDGDVLDRDAITAGKGMTVKGIVDTSPLRATLVIVRGDDDDADGDADDGTDDDDATDNGDDATTVKGELVSVDTADTLQLSVDGESRAVRLATDGKLVVSGRGLVDSGDLGVLADMTRVHLIVHGEPGTSYFEADKIVAIALDRGDEVIDEEEDDAASDDTDDDSDDDEEDGGRPDGAGPPDDAGPPDSEG